MALMMPSMRMRVDEPTPMAPTYKKRESVYVCWGQSEGESEGEREGHCCSQSSNLPLHHQWVVLTS